MKDTIKARVGYTVKVIDGKTYVYDGDICVMKATEISREEHREMLRENECYGTLEIFTTTAGKQYTYANDREIDTDYIIPCNLPTPDELYDDNSDYKYHHTGTRRG